MKFRLMRYVKIWIRTSSLSLQTQIVSRSASLIYILGKSIRFFFFWWLITRVGEKVVRISGYSVRELVIFFLIFNIFDILGQTLFRGIYWFRGDVVSGRFDLILIKPLSALFQVLTRHADFLDLPLLLIVIFLLSKQNINPTAQNWVNFIVVGIASFLIVTAIHIIVAAIGILTTEVDHTIMIYRDLLNMARVPIDIYTPTVKLFLTFVFPVAVIISFPAKAFMGILTFPWLIFSVLAAIVLFWVSLKVWRYALSCYSSASS